MEIAVVISDKADAYALERAEKAGIAAVAIPRKECVSKEEFEGKIDAALRAHGAELVVLAGFMRILSGNFVNKWTQKIINIHPALLPSFPGLDAQGHAICFDTGVNHEFVSHDTFCFITSVESEKFHSFNFDDSIHNC